MELMRDAASGDRDAYARLMATYAPSLRRLSYAILHESDAAEDVVQETFLRGLEKIGSFRGESSPRAWLTSIAINLCRHYLRDRKRGGGGAGEKTLESGRLPRKERTRGVVTRAAQGENMRLLAVALGFLTDAQREVLALRYEEGMDYDEIGQVLGIRAGAARALAHRAKTTLVERLGSEVWISRHL
jgi:RNA polymerase sigma factor (sigma-70 family)